jgi:NADH-quinone oxidoreductase subunit B
MRIQDKVRKMKEYHKGQPVELPVPARTGSVLLPSELATPEKAIEFLKENKERAKAAK